MSNHSINIKELRKTGGAVSEKDKTDKTGVWDLLNKDIRFFGSALPDKIKENFYLELGILLEAGVDIRTALELVEEEQTKAKYKTLFGSLQKRIIEGATLSRAMQDMGYFTTYEYYSIRIGEETGKLTMVLKDLGGYFQKKIAQQRQIISALTYPVVILLVSFGAVSFMMAYVVPMFADVLKRFGGDLPRITKMVLAASSWIQSSAGYLLLILSFLFFFCFSQRKKVWFRDLSGKLLINIPFIGSIVQKIYLSRFANTMSLMMASKIPILQAIQLIHKMIHFYPIEKTLASIEQDIVSGIPLNRSMSAYNIYPSKMVLLLKVGEEVNQMDVFFRKISDQFSNEVEHQTGVLSKLIEPFIIIVLGLVVGLILIAMYLPLFQLGKAF